MPKGKVHTQQRLKVGCRVTPLAIMHSLLAYFTPATLFIMLFYKRLSIRIPSILIIETVWGTLIFIFHYWNNLISPEKEILLPTAQTPHILAFFLGQFWFPISFYTTWGPDTETKHKATCISEVNLKTRTLVIQTHESYSQAKNQNQLIKFNYKLFYKKKKSTHS